MKLSCPQRTACSCQGQVRWVVQVEQIQRRQRQNPGNVLFTDTNMQNIAYARPNATQNKSFKAAKLARLHDAGLGMPNGYSTMVGERRLKVLSPRQTQSGLDGRAPL